MSFFFEVYQTSNPPIQIFYLTLTRFVEKPSTLPLPFESINDTYCADLKEKVYRIPESTKQKKYISISSINSVGQLFCIHFLTCFCRFLYRLVTFLDRSQLSSELCTANWALHGTIFFFPASLDSSPPFNVLIANSLFA